MKTNKIHDWKQIEIPMEQFREMLCAIGIPLPEKGKAKKTLTKRGKTKMTKA